MKVKQPKVYTYTRVSTAMQIDGYSLEAQKARMKAFSDLEDESAPVRREYEHYEACMVSREFFRETRLLGGFSYFKRLYLEALDLMQRLKYKASMKSNLFELSMRILTVAGYVGILFLLFDALMKREVSVGAFAAVFNSLGMLYSLMEEIICRHISDMAQNMGSIQNYLNFLDLEERKSERSEEPGWGDIVLTDVSFSYPGAEADAIREVSFTLKKGETLAADTRKRYDDFIGEYIAMYNYDYGYKKVRTILATYPYTVGAVILIALAPLFSSEYTRKTDALLLSSQDGKKNLAYNKIKAGLIVALAVWGIMTIFNLLIIFSIYDKKNWRL